VRNAEFAVHHIIGELIVTTASSITDTHSGMHFIPWKTHNGSTGGKPGSASGDKGSGGTIDPTHTTPAAWFHEWHHTAHDWTPPTSTGSSGTSPTTPQPSVDIPGQITLPRMRAA
jgi:hypothetical protein